mmetsp:Transcript_117901/g.241001  ORF Transcript_117901/g.241001 Transcript_117901/m.241001 type:complete len:279 (-) Transcript_117901:448-1284(-)
MSKEAALVLTAEKGKAISSGRLRSLSDELRLGAHRMQRRSMLLPWSSNGQAREDQVLPKSSHLHLARGSLVGLFLRDGKAGHRGTEEVRPPLLFCRRSCQATHMRRTTQAPPAEHRPGGCIAGVVGGIGFEALGHQGSNQWRGAVHASVQTLDTAMALSRSHEVELPLERNALPGSVELAEPRVHVVRVEQAHEQGVDAIHELLVQPFVGHEVGVLHLEATLKAILQRQHEARQHKVHAKRRVPVEALEMGPVPVHRGTERPQGLARDLRLACPPVTT